MANTQYALHLNMLVGEAYDLTVHGDGWAMVLTEATLLEVKRQANGKDCYLFESPHATLPVGLLATQITDARRVR